MRELAQPLFARKHVNLIKILLLTCKLGDTFMDAISLPLFLMSTCPLTSERSWVFVQDFDYTKSTRYEIDKDTRSIYIRCAGVEVNYGYDYEGLNQRAVVTPTTDRCAISFLHALTACVCGAFVGPADVGKSAAVREISKLVGRFVIIVNCHQHLDLEYFEKCFTGLPACGCFGCFDELNRLTYSVLSAIAQQLNQVIRMNGCSTPKSPILCRKIDPIRKSPTVTVTLGWAQRARPSRCVHESSDCDHLRGSSG